MYKITRARAHTHTGTHTHTQTTSQPPPISLPGKLPAQLQALFNVHTHLRGPCVHTQVRAHMHTHGGLAGIIGAIAIIL